LAKAQHATLRTGPNADLGGIPLMDADDAWNRDISRDEVDPLSEAIITPIGADKPLHEYFGLVWKGAPGGIPHQVAGKDQPRVPVILSMPMKAIPAPIPFHPTPLLKAAPRAMATGMCSSSTRTTRCSSSFSTPCLSTADGPGKQRAGPSLT
jgi:hypothetical protein